MKRTIIGLLVSFAAFASAVAFLIAAMGHANKETVALLSGTAIGVLVAGPCGAICVYLALMQLDETPKQTLPQPPVIVREPIIVIASPARAGNQAEVIDAVVRYAGSYQRAMELWQEGKVKVIE